MSENTLTTLRIIVCIGAIAGFFSIRKDYITSIKEKNVALKAEAAVEFISLIAILVSLMLGDIAMHIGNKECAKLEAALQAGNLYYNGEQIPAKSMTPNQIYSCFSYSIVDGDVYVYTKY